MKQAKYQFNIGLSVSGHYPNKVQGGPAQLARTVYGLAMYGFYMDTLEVQQSDTEQTAVLVATDQGPAHNLHNRLHDLAVYLGQDCIAVRDESGHGELFGEHPWGAFDHSLFITPKV